VEPEDVDVGDMDEGIHEGIQEEDIGFDVVENITSDVYQQRRQDCERKKLELIESSFNVTCKSGGTELLWTVVPDSIPESQPIEFQNIGIREMDWDKFNRLSSYAKASVKNKLNDEKPHPFMDLFLLLWPGDWKK
jgi:hypothetical protein